MSTHRHRSDEMDEAPWRGAAGDVRWWTREMHAPRAIVESSESASNALERSGWEGCKAALRAAERVQGLNVPMRTAGDHSYRLREFWLRFMTVDDYMPPDPERSLQLLTNCVSKNQNLDAKMFHPRVGMASEEVHREMQEDPMPWLPEYGAKLHDSLRFSKHETLDQPLLRLFVISTESSDPVRDLEGCQKRVQDSLMAQDGFVQPGIITCCLLLHDKQALTEQLEQTLQLIRNKMPSLKLHVLELDFTAIEAEGNVPSTAAEHGRTSGEVATAATMQLQDFVKKLVTQEVLPWMELRIRQLHSYIASTRKGFRNQLKSFLLGSSKRAEEFLPESTLYGSASIETQLRTLADLCFLLQDYELAGSSYRMLASDYKAKKAWKHYAGAQEWLGYSIAMADGTVRDVQAAYENAFHAYIRSGLENRAFAVRACLFWARLVAFKGFMVDAASVLILAAGVDGFPGKAGVLLEAAAYCFAMNTEQPMLRKFVFNIVLAGHKYNQDGHKVHALRCYASVFEIFEGSRWSYIKEHVAYMIAKKARSLERKLLEAEAFMSLLTCTHPPMATQAAYLDMFMSAAKGLEPVQMETLSQHLSIPLFNMEDIHVHFEGQFCYNDGAHVQASTDWLQMHESLIPKDKIGSSTWLDSNENTKNKDGTNNTVANEWIGVDVIVTNVLQITLELPKVCLVCEFKENGEVPVPENMIEIADLQVVMLPGEVRKLTLWVRPLCPGFLVIKGVTWSFFGLFLGEKKFLLKDRPGSGFHASYAKCSPWKHLAFNVLADMPNLSVSFDELGEATLESEVRPFMMMLTNKGKAALENLHFCCDTEELIPEESATRAPIIVDKCVEDGTASVAAMQRTLGSRTHAGGTVYTFGDGLQIDAGCTIEWPMWWFSSKSGEHVFRVAFYYESCTPVQGMSYRILHLTLSMTATPLFDMTVHRFESETSASAKILGVRIRQILEGPTMVPHSIFSVNSRKEMTKCGEAHLLPEQMQLGDEQSFVMMVSDALDGDGILPCTSTSMSSACTVNRSHAVIQKLCEQMASWDGTAGEWDPGLALYWNTVDPVQGNRWGLTRMVSLGAEDANRVRVIMEPSKLEVFHDFSSLPLCALQIHLHVYNGLPCSLKYWITTSDPEDEPLLHGLGWRVGGTGSALSAPASSSFFWSGNRSTSPEELHGSSTAIVPMEVTILSPGLHILHGCRIHWCPSSIGMEVHSDAVLGCNVSVVSMKKS